MRDCRIFQGSVDFEKGFFVTKQKPENRGVLNNSGYYLINLKRKGEKTFKIVTMQLAIYLEACNIERIPRGFVLHHRDNCTGNNAVANLQLVTPSYNALCAARNKDYAQIYLTRKKNGFVQKIKASGPENEELFFDSMSKCAQDFGVNCGTISRIINKKKYYSKLMKNDKIYTFSRVK